MMKFLTMLRFPFLSGIFLPFKIWHPSKIKIRSGVALELGSRVTLGSSAKGSAVVSLLPINLYFGVNGNVRFGHSVSIGPGVNLIVKKNARFSVGDSTYFTSDSHIEVVSLISIGSNCAISWGVTMIDDDHHTLMNSDGSTSNKPAELIIGDHVWIGCNVTILKGTRIGNNCVVAAGSVVKGIFPDNTLIAGNPAIVVKENIDWR